MRLSFKSLWAHRVQGVLRRRPPVNGTGAPAAPAPALPVDADWDEAFLRVESYLRAHHIESRVLLSRLTTEILTAARSLAGQLPGEAPVTIAMRVAHARIGDWLQTALGEGDWADERFRARGRLALLLSEIPHQAPERFLAPEPLAPPLRDRLQVAGLAPAPGMLPTGMPPAPLEFPLAEIAEEKWETFSRSTFFRAAASWFLFLGLLGATWIVTR
jgi:hypothetical protein